MNFAAGGTISFSSSTTTKPTLFDYNGDGLLDLIMANAPLGTVYPEVPILLYLNVGSSTNPLFSAPDTIKADGAPIMGVKPSVALGDLDSDNLPDLIIISYAGSTFGDARLYRNSGTPTAPHYTTSEDITFKNNIIPSGCFLDWSDYQGNFPTMAAMIESGDYWGLEGKGIVNITITDYNGDGTNDVLLGIGGFTTSEWSDILGYYVHESEVVVFYNTPPTPLAPAPLSAKKSLSYAHVNQHELRITPPTSGVYKVEVFSVKGERIAQHQMALSRGVPHTVSLMSYGAGMHLIKVSNSTNTPLVLKALLP